MENGESEREIQKLRREIAALRRENAETGLLYHAWIEMSQDMVIVLDRDKKCLLVNAAAAASFDTTPGEMAGKPIHEFIAPDVSRYLEKHIDRVFETGEPFVNEMPFLLPPKQLWAYQRIMPVKRDSGEVVSVICVTYDITDRKLAESALRESEERFRQVIEQMPYPVQIFAPDGTTVMVNSAFLEIMRIPSSDAIIGKSNLFTGRCAAPGGLVDKIRRAFDGATVYHSDYALSTEIPGGKKPEGKEDVVFLDLTFFPVYLRPGELFHVVGIFKDVTERKRAELALTESEKKMRTQYKSFPLPTYTWQKAGDDFVLVDCNEASIHFTSGGVKKLIGKKISQVFSHEPSILDNMARCMNEKTVITVEAPNVFPITKIQKQLNVTYVFVEPDLVMVHTVDVTEKQKMEQELRKAERLESLGLLAGGIAHDFNNLLAGVFGYIGLAREYGRDNANVKDCLDKALLVFGQAKALTQQLLTFAKGGSPVRKLASIGDLLRDMSTFVLAGSGVKPDISIPPDLPACEVDIGQLSEVINNLLINAQQAMPDGGVIEIAAKEHTVHEHGPLPLAAGRYVLISIRDHGIGIPPDQLNRIFDPFYSTKKKGSGLGLTIAYSIIKKHNGHIEILSEAGAGSEARIYLPASHETILEAARPQDGPQSRQGRVLLMDDETFLLDAIGKIIMSLGYGVATASNGHEAIELYRKAMNSDASFDAVILDLTVPGGMGGKQAMLEMKKADPRVRAIATSGYSEDPVISDPRASGFKGALLKPYTIEELGAVLEKVISEPA